MTAIVWRREVSTLGADAAYPDFLAEGRGACADDDLPDDFTEDGDRPWQKAMRERARRVCLECPFRVPCDQWAVQHHAQGMYGGRSTWERTHARDEGGRIRARAA